MNEGLDPTLLRLFDSAPTADINGEVFLSITLARLKRARRTRLFLRVALTAIIVAMGAILAPYAAMATLTITGWLVDYLPETGMALASPIGCVCAALIAWRIARRRFG
jgi:hypothetical protein